MSDGQQPLFFGGLPPRSSLVVEPKADKLEKAKTEKRPAKSPAPRPDRPAKKPSKFGKRTSIALIVSALSAMAIVGGLVVSMSMNGGELDPTAGPNTSGSKISPEEAAAAEAAIASGGGAIEGHIVSAELCTALAGFSAVSADGVSSVQVTPEVLAAVEGLAAVASPNQGAYQSFADMLKNPDREVSIADAQATAADFAKATQVDIVTCA